MATNNSVNSGLSGTTGTGNFVGANTPTLITPVIGAATGTSLSLTGQVAFSAYLSASQANVTGDGTLYEVIFDTIVNQTGGTNYNNATGVFTAPTTGYYLITSTINVSNITSGANYVVFGLYGSTNYLQLQPLGVFSTAFNSQTAIEFNRIIYMAASDDIKVTIEIDNGGAGKVQGLAVNNDNFRNWFSVYKLP